MQKALRMSKRSCSIIFLLRSSIQHVKCRSSPVLERGQSPQSYKTNDHSPVHYELQDPCGRNIFVNLYDKILEVWVVTAQFQSKEKNTPPFFEILKSKTSIDYLGFERTFCGKQDRVLG